MAAGSSRLDLEQATFFDVEADRAERVIVVAGVRGEREFRIDVARLSTESAVRALRDALGDGLLAGHNAVAHDVPRLQAEPLSLDFSGRDVLDTLVLFMLAEPGRTSHALDKAGRAAGAVPDPDQFRLLSALVGLDRRRVTSERTERSLFVVGDDDQAIYGFRKASLEFLQRFEAGFSAERICLVENFRSSAPIVGACSAFIRNNPDRIKISEEEQLRPAAAAPAGDDRSARRFLCGSREQAAAHAAYAVVRSMGEDLGSIAVLARNWADLDPLRVELEASNIPFTIHHRDQHRPLHRRYPVDRAGPRPRCLARAGFESRCRAASPASGLHGCAHASCQSCQRSRAPSAPANGEA